MANIRDLNRKIGSLKNMQKVMSAMNMIASTKFKKVSRLQQNLKDFSINLEKIEAQISGIYNDSNSPYIIGNRNAEKIMAVLFTADRGLCGSHNSSIHKALLHFIDTEGIDKNNVLTACIGKKGTVFCRKNGFAVETETEIVEKVLTEAKLQHIADEIMQKFTTGKVNKVIMIYNEFVSTLVQSTKIQKIIPLTVMTPAEGIKTVTETATEPSGDKFLEQAMRAVLAYRMKIAIYNSYLSENASRMTAMENAANNADDLIFRYGKIKNRARQTTITNELIEIVAGKEALKE